jgi:hypothetical protein
MSDVDQTFFLLLLIFCLGACLVTAFREAEAVRQRRRERKQFIRDAMRSTLIMPERNNTNARS